MKLFRDFRNVVADLTGKGQHQVVDALSAQIGSARQAVEVVREATSGGMSLDVVRARVGDIENEGDAHRGELVRTLARTLVIPIDREDLFRLSRSIDDVLDNLRDFARELDLFGEGEPDLLGVQGGSPLFRPILDAVAGAVDELATAIGGLSDSHVSAVAGSLRSKKQSNEIRLRYQLAVAELLSGELSNATLKRRELLRRLDVVGLRIGEAADALADGAQKRGN